MSTRTSNRTASATVGTKRTAPPTGPHIAEIAEQDCKKVCNPDLNRPFTNLEDAVDRLLPYHILDTEEDTEIDLKEAEEAGSSLALTRWEAWQGYAIKRANDIEKSKWKLNNRIDAAEKSAFEKSETIQLALHTYAAAEAERDVAAEKRRRAAARKEAEKKRQLEVMKMQQQIAIQMQMRMAANAKQAAEAAEREKATQEAAAAATANENAAVAAAAAPVPVAAPIAAPVPPPAPAPPPAPVIKTEEEKRKELLLMGMKLKSKK